MTPQLLILCVDDERDVLDAVMADLQPFAEHFVIDAAQSVDEARELLQDSPQTPLALILCDHIMPGTNGVDFLIELNQNETTRHARKLLLTGQAGLEATIDAVNRGGLDFYISKPWQVETLQTAVRQQLTEYIMAHGHDPLPYVAILDTQKLTEMLQKQRFSYPEN